MNISLCWPFGFLILGSCTYPNKGIAKELVEGVAFYDLLCRIENKFLILSMRIINYIFRFILEYNIMYKNKSLKRMKGTL